MNTGAGPPERQPALRASDADRERAVQTLRAAVSDGRLAVDELDARASAAYAARTVDELTVLTADLQRPGSSQGQGVTVRREPGGTRTVISVMGGSERRGRWRIAARCFVLNLMGGSEVDLTQAELSADATRITVVSVMGGGEVRVPRGVDVRVSKLALMGGNDVRLDDAPPPPGSPAIHVRLLSLMGGTQVRQGPRRPRRGAIEAAEDRRLER